jgi:EAL domain-containing protein (putative c-di-GMP-specific phosphodiesterase class I)
VAERILKELQIPFHIAGRDVMSGTSIGIALSITGYDTVDAMIRDADSAMYRAKSAGRNRYEVFDSAMHDEAANLLRLEADLARAVTRDEFVLEYLPVFTVPDRKLAGLEALVRWDHPERGRLAPGLFIEAAEDSGLIVPIGWWVMRHACEQLRHWQDTMGGAARTVALSVNLSGRQFLQQDLVPRIDEILKDTGLDPQFLRLEIAEKDIMRNADPAVKVLADLDARGIQLSIDDFGTGYSSLSYLQRFPLDSFKIDRSFVSQLGRNQQSARSAGLVRSILALGRSLNIPAVAEGVETEAQLAELQELGVQYAQGFLLSMPIAAAAVPDLLRQG